MEIIKLSKESAELIQFKKPHKLGLVLLLLGLAPWGLFFLNKNPSLMMPLSGFTGLMTLAGLFIWAKRFSFDLIPDERMFQKKEKNGSLGLP